MNRYGRARGISGANLAKAIGRATLVILVVMAPMFGFAVSTQPSGCSLISIGEVPPAYADCEGPNPPPDYDGPCAPTPTPTPTPDNH